jgi:nicotinamidase-related amidase
MKRAAIFIDFINDFFQPKSPMFVGSHVKKIIPVAVGILDEFRKKKETIIFICDAHHPEDQELKIYPKHAMRDTSGAEIIPQLSPLPGEYKITKRCYSGIFSTPMADVLKRNYVQEVHLLGVCGSICVMETAAGLFYHGFNIVLHKKAITDVKAADLAYALKRMQKLFNAKIV